MTMRTGRDTRGAAPPRVRRALATVLAAAATASILGATLGHAPVARASEPGETWVPELAVEGGDDTNVVATTGAVRLAAGVVRAQSARSTRNEGELLLAPRRSSTPVDRVTAEVTADVPPGGEVLVDVRGLRTDGTWSQWSTASPAGPAVLAQPATELQVRVTLVSGDFGASPALQRLWLAADRSTPTPAPTAPPAPPAPTAPPTVPTAAPAPAPEPAKAAPVTSRVFATRIGLVGNTTANGHVIVPRDHFVALPSRRGLSPRDKGDYTVKVCAANGRCAWSPVWDVGPWNIRDDYWNAARQQWGDLPLGFPQAQAAFQRGYNGGKDGFGRRVANPAGIDLADGTYYDDLQLRDNGWVTVTYLWTGTGPSALARPTGAPTLVVRSAPTDASSSVGAVASGARMAVTCTATGQLRAGSQGPSAQWLQIGPQQYVPAAAVEAPRVAPC
ncbi:hypothetical protein [Actinomycetospora termitidis]|uniref:Ig-like domain-containing protein n=1 Tax=Actinomycetospora termitidis TaxID=3053470 RepID=A0ABT7M897_9PSEU|nr:hypothetical protein [Actinomycetospora sp. Odt1-22]MDL5156890.1 hypothetical protein [Actinomycetospora sp. Odt1-22]